MIVGRNSVIQGRPFGDLLPLHHSNANHFLSGTVIKLFNGHNFPRKEKTTRDRVCHASFRSDRSNRLSLHANWRPHHLSSKSCHVYIKVLDSCWYFPHKRNNMANLRKLHSLSSSSFPQNTCTFTMNKHWPQQHQTQVTHQYSVSGLIAYKVKVGLWCMEPYNVLSSFVWMAFHFTCF